MKQIYIVKGYIGDIKISQASFPLINVNTHLGITTAVVDASSLLGDEYKTVTVDLHAYNILD